MSIASYLRLQPYRNTHSALYIWWPMKRVQFIMQKKKKE